MTNIKKLLTAGALIIGLQSATFGYNPTVCNNQITEIEIAMKSLKPLCNKESVEAIHYLKNAIQNVDSTSDKIIIKLAEILNSSKSLDEKISCILTIKTKEKLQKEQSNRGTLIISTIMGTLYATLVTYVLYSIIRETITLEMIYHKNNLITQITDQLTNNQINNNNLLMDQINKNSSNSNSSLLTCLKNKLSL